MNFFPGRHGAVHHEGGGGGGHDDGADSVRRGGRAGVRGDAAAGVHHRHLDRLRGGGGALLHRGQRQHPLPGVRPSPAVQRGALRSHLVHIDIHTL